MKCDLDVVDIGCDEEDGVDIEIENAPTVFPFLTPVPQH